MVGTVIACDCNYTFGRLGWRTTQLSTGTGSVMNVICEIANIIRIEYWFVISYVSLTVIFMCVGVHPPRLRGLGILHPKSVLPFVNIMSRGYRDERKYRYDQLNGREKGARNTII